MSAQVERAMCSAIPTAAARWGRAEQGCASHALDVVEHAGVERPVCGMHRVTWEHAGDFKNADERRAGLAEKWGWI